MPDSNPHNVSSRDMSFSIGEDRIVGRFVWNPALVRSGVLFVHGWDDDQQHYEDMSEDLAASGVACGTFDLRGHGASSSPLKSVSRSDNLADVSGAYAELVRQPELAGRAISLVGTSYGGYLAALASRLKPVRSLALRVPALYPDPEWHRPKKSFDRTMLRSYRSHLVLPSENRALGACAEFAGDVLLVESEHDDVLPRPSIDSFAGAFKRAKSMLRHCIDGADHALSDPAAQAVYRRLLLSFLERCA